MEEKTFVYKSTLDIGDHVREMVRDITNNIDNLVLSELQDGTLFKLIDMCQEELDRRRHLSIEKRTESLQDRF